METVSVVGEMRMFEEIFYHHKIIEENCENEIGYKSKGEKK